MIQFCDFNIYSSSNASQNIRDGNSAICLGLTGGGKVNCIEQKRTKSDQMEMIITSTVCVW